MAETMTMIRYDEASLVRTLAQLERKLRVAFAAACAERLLPAYSAFVTRTGKGDADKLIEIMNRIWQNLQGNETPLEDVSMELRHCTALIPREDEKPWSDEQPYAEDAASAIAYTLRALESGEAQEAAWAARRAYEALDYFVTNRLDIEDDEEALGHPVVQAELMRQVRDLEELSRAGQDPHELMVLLCKRAKAEAHVFFDSPYR